MGTHETTSHARLDVLTVNYDTSGKSKRSIYICATHTSMYVCACLYVLLNFTCDNFFWAAKCYAKGLTLVYVALRQSKGMANNLVGTRTQKYIHTQIHTHTHTRTQTAQTFSSGNSQPSTSASF